MSDLNVWVGSGRITRDTELRYTPNGTAVAEVGLCCNRTYSKDGKKEEEVLFVDVTLWGKRAEALSEYLTKGKFVTVNGRLQMDSWETDEGVKRSRLRIVANEINFGPNNSSKKETANKEAETETEEEVPF